MLDEISLKGSERVLDLGAGSGVLSLLVAQKGARVVALDIEPRAARICYENARENGFQERIEVVCGDLSAVRGAFDLILANLYLRLLVPLAQEIIFRLKDGGMLLLSGFLEACLPQIETAYRGLKTREKRVFKGWAAILLEKSIP
jgi:ribosomal protein L11 methyltransferase